jgi:hypothetical protein
MGESGNGSQRLDNVRIELIIEESNWLTLNVLLKLLVELKHWPGDCAI